MKNSPLLSEPLAAHDSGGELQPGVIYGANEARLTASTYSEPLTAYTVGWKDSENIEATLEFLAPSVQVGRRFEFKKANNAEQFFSDTDDVRAIGSEFKRVEFSGTTINEKTHNKGLTYRIDRDEDLVDEQTVVSRLMTRLLRNELRRAITVAQAAATNTAKTWNAAAQPDEDMRGAIAAHQLALGVFPNRGLISLVAWNLRATSFSGQNNAGAYAGLARDPAAVGQMLGLDDLRLTRELFQVTATAKQRILTSHALFFFGENGIMKDDPSSLKRFVTRPQGAGKFNVLRFEKGKFIDITVEHYSNTIAAAGGLQQLTIS
jgi:hypothetical protein